MLTDVQRDLRPRFPSNRRVSRGGLVRRASRLAGFTLAEVLAALLLMAIVIPVTLEGVSVASRAGTLGQRKAAAMRIAERVLDEQIVTGLVNSATPYGSIVEGNTAYPWTMKSEPWTEDANAGITVVTVRVQFDLQGNTYDVAVSTLYNPNAATTTTSGAAPATTTQ